MNRKDADTARRLGADPAGRAIEEAQRRIAAKLAARDLRLPVRLADSELGTILDAGGTFIARTADREIGRAMVSALNAAARAPQHDPHTSAVCEYVTHGIGSPDCQDDDCECSCHEDDTAQHLGPSAWRDDWMTRKETPMPTEPPFDPVEAAAAIERASRELGEICRQGARNRWRMSIPAQPDRDSDLIIAAGLNAGDLALAKLAELTAKPSPVREPIRALTDEEAARCKRQWDAHYAPRASQAATATNGAGCGAGAAHDPHGAAAGRTERCESRHPERGLLCTLPAGHDTHRHVGDAWTTLDRLDGHVLVRALDLAEMLTYIADLGTIHRANATFDRLSTALKEAAEADQ